MGETQSSKRVKGEIVAFAKLMAALTTLKRRERLSEFDMDVYETALAGIPLQILSKAVQQWLVTEEWFPTIKELLETCEAVRVEIRAQLLFSPCEHCSKDGWTERLIDGVMRAVKCDCWRIHQAKVAALGVPATPLALPSGRAANWTDPGEVA